MHEVALRAEQARGAPLDDLRQAGNAARALPLRSRPALCLPSPPPSLASESIATPGVYRPDRSKEAADRVTQGTGALSAEQARSPPLELRQVRKRSNQGTASPILWDARTSPSLRVKPPPPSVL